MSSTPPTSLIAPRTWTRDNRSEFFISTDPALLSVAAVKAAFEQDFVYWSQKSFPEDVLWQMLHGSMSFGVYRWTESPAPEKTDSRSPRPENTEQIGLARMVTDGATFAYLSDVYVLPEYQGNGLGRWLIDCVAEIFSKENMPYLRRIILLTDDQRMQDFYQKIIGAKVVGHEERKDMDRTLVFMCARPNATP
ncbi:Acyl-CoA N-acyltransferase [Penicillium alfredii]|uniref:Acyl-CoA N-acyltransferase n=1 Tax=Penicillium alfredii TaxID=1506179 RepID=A0A9W9FTX1_9EURO|nr:Acyl-CoA N-acyltransferase [Penicillium alfredii]KAJ5106010.1 Acyl-CoA N-acyltransferase [Penicillium alfredii]